MLIYNYEKEFLGIDKKDLNTLGFADLASLRAEVADFADLFVKTPGYIHNFKHVHWIDFITCAESNEKPKAIINVNSKNFKCNLSVTTAFLVDNPGSEAYLVHLTNLHLLSDEENELIAADLSNRTVEYSEPTQTTIIPSQAPSQTVQSVVQEQPLQPSFVEHEFDDFNDIQTAAPSFHDQTAVLSTDEMDTKLDINLDDEYITPTQSFTQVPDLPTQQETSAVPQPKQDDEDEHYVYDPKVASDELGLPLDLIEEFIQDFILQAKEFKDDLYNSLDSGDIENVKILSHKLKGVAANLRIENAFEVLTIINTTEDPSVIAPNLDRLYRIVAKLAGEEPPVSQHQTPQVTAPKTEPEQEESFVDEPEIMLADEIDTPIQEQSTTETTQEKVAQDDDAPLDIDLDLDLPLDIENEVEEKVEEPLDVSEDIQLVDDEPQIQQASPKEHKKRSATTINFSKAQAAQEIGIDLESYKELLQDYEDEAESIFKNMKEALKKGDTTQYDNELKKFRGMTENIRITHFQQTIENLTNNHDLESVVPQLDDMKNIIIQILQQKD